MKKIVSIVAVVMGLMMAGNSVKAQAGSKIGYISLQELIPSMSEYKKADTALNDYQNALGQQFDDMRKEYYEKDSLLNSKDTVKYTTAQKEMKRREFNELLVKLQGWQQQKEEELRRAIEKREFEVWYQHVYLLSEGQLDGFEALLRWRRADGSHASFL